MRKKYDYQVCFSQFDRITFANDVWQGTIGPEGVDPMRAVETCPMLWDFLQAYGQQGWKLVAVVSQVVEKNTQQVLYFVRESMEY